MQTQWEATTLQIAKRDYETACVVCGFLMYHSEAYAIERTGTGDDEELFHFCSAECFAESVNHNNPF